MSISQTIHNKNGVIVIQIDMIHQVVYAFNKEFLKTLFNSEDELDNDFLFTLIKQPDFNFATKISDYYNTGITTNI